MVPFLFSNKDHNQTFQLRLQCNLISFPLRYHSINQTPPGPTNQPSLARRELSSAHSSVQGRRLSVGLRNGGGLRRHPPPHLLPQGYGRQGLASTNLPSYVHLCASVLSTRRCRMNWLRGQWRRCAAQTAPAGLLLDESPCVGLLEPPPASVNCVRVSTRLELQRNGLGSWG